MAGQIEALLHELERHTLGGRTERVAAIKRELADLGHNVDEPAAPVVPVVETADAAQVTDTTAVSSVSLPTADAPAAPETTVAPSVGA
jgi:hypothetical protein